MSYTLTGGFSYDPDAGVCYRLLGFMGFPGYRVGDDGSVWSCWKRHHTPGIRGGQRVIGTKWLLKKPHPNRSGYLSLSLSRNGKAKTFRLNRIVLQVFIGPCPAGMESCHANGKESDNRLCNLRWGTKKENAQDKIAHGTSARGERNIKHKVASADIPSIRAEYHAGGLSFAELGRRHGMSRSSMRKLVLGMNWGHIND